MARRIWTRKILMPVIYLAGVYALLFALLDVTVSATSYEKLLREALYLSAFAVICFTAVVILAPRAWKWTAAISIMPVVYVIYEVCTRIGK